MKKCTIVFSVSDSSQIDDVIAKINEMYGALSSAEVTSGCVVDGNAEPFNPWKRQGWVVAEHQKDGEWQFNLKQVILLLTDKQKNNELVKGVQLLEEIKDRFVFNANVLDGILAMPHIAPEEWKGNEQDGILRIVFPGTIYRNLNGDSYVRYLYWHNDKRTWSSHWRNGEWSWGVISLAENWGSNMPMAVYANQTLQLHI